MSKRWCFTLNNYEDHDLADILKWDVKYLVVGSEVSESGTPHFQGFVILKKNHRLSGVKKLNSRAHWEIAKGTSHQAADYCKKDGDFHEVGTPPRQGERTDLTFVANLIKDGASVREVADEAPETFMKFSKGIYSYKLLLSDGYDHDQTRGIWIWGPPGTGKSHAARNFDTDLYIKPQNKWWDGYENQKTVLLDDLDTSVLGHYLKIWADKWSCTGEVKGGTVHLVHTLFVVTSNYSIEQLWPNDMEMQRAIARRFRVIHKTSRESIVDFLVHN